MVIRMIGVTSLTTHTQKTREKRGKRRGGSTHQTSSINDREWAVEDGQDSQLRQEREGEHEGQHACCQKSESRQMPGHRRP